MFIGDEVEVSCDNGISGEKEDEVFVSGDERGENEDLFVFVGEEDDEVIVGK